MDIKIIVVLVVVVVITALLLTMSPQVAPQPEKECSKDGDCKFVVKCCNRICVPSDYDGSDDRVCACEPLSDGEGIIVQNTYCECQGGTCQERTDWEGACDNICEYYLEGDCNRANKAFWDSNCADYSCGCFEEGVVVGDECAGDEECVFYYENCCAAPAGCANVENLPEQPDCTGVACEPLPPEYATQRKHTSCECDSGFCELTVDLRKACKEICDEYKQDCSNANENVWKDLCSGRSCECFEEEAPPSGEPLVDDEPEEPEPQIEPPDVTSPEYALYVECLDEGMTYEECFG